MWSGTRMEIFKTHMGSWTYPEPALVRIDGVPLFTGFMYAAVGSYLARVIRIFDMRFTNYPRFVWTVLLSHRDLRQLLQPPLLPDMRWLLFAWTLLLFGRVRIYFTVDRVPRWMPLIVAGLLTAFFLWIAENVGTATGTWLYPGAGAGSRFRCRSSARGICSSRSASSSSRSSTGRASSSKFLPLQRPAAAPVSWLSGDVIGDGPSERPRWT